ncbi:CNPV308 ankyrin repeat protein [Canarypox virus]|uniref:CNPV308 ankyrin repeat protein n=2 Tax=Avipoxvirus TaxID=10260 RepID=Q6VZ39_CNPV|nr:CNPV308 ankyrin repeat protein [Canarypox virus]QRM15587.1 ankyrin repeat protein [Mudlarkpox virus]UOX38557.1 ankyrin repeat containing protein [Finch poxvirus]AAR83654.1 CNPV308 ankyrin repeat protein [Canarypox virus]AWD84784.1 ankyrin repeat protein [Canarypox virus]UOX38891.1 ankyrin repeat containing protein [Finch poxvirus]
MTMEETMIMKHIILNDNISLKKALDYGYTNPNFSLNGETPLRLATKLRNTEAVKILMRHVCYPENQHLPLHCAVKKGDIKEVKNLLDKKEYINNVFYEGGYTPLNLAVALGSKQIVRLLLENGADPDICSTDLLTPLHIAVRLNSKDIIDLLLTFNANPDLEDCFRCTPLIHAATGGYTDICSILINHGADINYVSSAGDNALLSAVDNNKLYTVKLLLDKGANSNVLLQSGPNIYGIMEVINYSGEVSMSVSVIIADIILSKYKYLDDLSKVGQCKNLAVIDNSNKYEFVVSKCKNELGIISNIVINGVSLLDIYNEKLWHLIQGDSKLIFFDKVIGLDKNISLYSYIIEKLASMI